MDSGNAKLNQIPNYLFIEKQKETAYSTCVCKWVYFCEIESVYDGSRPWLKYDSPLCL